MSAQYERFVEQNLVVKIRTGNEYMTNCPWCEGSDPLQINVEKGLWICFACDERGNIAKLQKKLGARFVDLGADVADIRRKLDELTEGKPQFDDLPALPESTLKRYAFPTDYWTERGFDPKTTRAFDLGYDPLNNFAIIPIRNVRGDLIGFIRRDLDPDALVRYKYPKGFKRSRALFASWFLEQSPSSIAVVTEGAVDCMKVWQAGYAAVSVYGSSMSLDQMKLLMRLGITRLVLFYDNDRAGKKALDRTTGWVTRKVRKQGREQEVREYVPYLDARTHFICSAAEYGPGPKDPGAMTTPLIRNAVENARGFV
jgi:DNA primase